MEFYVLIIIIAVVALIAILTGIGLIMLNRNTVVTVFPPDALQCPDYWTMDANGNCIAGMKNTGVFSPGYSQNPKNIASKGLTTICSQKKWANTNNVVWTGVDNYNQC
jgi:hypothetical protein